MGFSEEDWGGYGPTSKGSQKNGNHAAFNPSGPYDHSHTPASPPPPPVPSNKGTALESLTAGGIWALLFTPYVALVLALLLDLQPHYRVATTTPFAGCVLGLAMNGKGRCYILDNANG